MLATETNIIKERLLKSYNIELDHSGISGERIAERLNEISKIGLTEDNGSNRIGFSKEERMAKELVKSWMENAGLKVKEDGAGNIFGRLEGDNPNSTVLSGSHVDSVPNGGHFDGPLGVIAALEVVEAWNAAGYKPKRSYEVVIFSDEEGSRFNGGLRGSRAFCGELDMKEEEQKKDSNGDPFQKVIESDGLTLQSFMNTKRDLKKIKAFVEIHIEQGKILEKQNVPVGIVSGIAGPSWLRITFHGESGHAGNTPMNDRSDALIAASDFIGHVSLLPQQVSRTAVATVGKLHVYPNGVNVISEKVELYVDIRDIQQHTLDSLTDLIKRKAVEIGDLHKIKVDFEQTLNVSPVPIDETMQNILIENVKKLGIKPVLLPSGAAHDTMVLGRNVPSAMIFVRSKNGISHSPKEWTTLDDCVQAIHVLKSAIESLVSE
ncbi:M20 family metallo-hydrolase [Bacillus sp. NEB1478]|uniref:M20 family metallo-hydrolase n=1 Tax=Bacillus sp. NEB1478 TaxID=3073816 RepID=UPI002873A28A|nr:M20 family metallo-hydrolase [Bacillus sp. NEB1478]WNB91729.1 M20 family metallo-hydrolase [Bacillus sp. NEB1478]